MIDSLEKNACTGCSACYNICPKKAISMQADKDGFLFPYINSESCIECNLCAKICPSMCGINQLEKRYSRPIVKAAWSMDSEIRINSTSGGVFSELARKFLTENSFVVGAVYNKDFLVEHYIIDEEKDIYLLRQSKYVQSEKKDIFIKTKELLDRNNRVLFVGAPCEIAGLYNFLQKNYTNLFTVDFICLGINSPKIYMKFLEMLQEKYNSKIKRVWFKNKTYGWNLFSTKIEFENGKIYLQDRKHDYFMRGYIGKNKFYVRKSCLQCKYKGFPRIADISLGDFWGIGKKYPELDEDKGTSAVLINSDKGKIFYLSLDKKRVRSYTKSVEDVVRGNFALMGCPILDERCAAFFSDLDTMRFDTLIEKYCANGIRDKIRLMFSYLKRVLKIKQRL